MDLYRQPEHAEKGLRCSAWNTSDEVAVKAKETAVIWVI